MEQQPQEPMEVEEETVEETTCSASLSTAQTSWGTVRAEEAPSPRGAPSTLTSLTDLGRLWLH